MPVFERPRKPLNTQWRMAKTKMGWLDLKPGDRILEDNGNSTVITPKAKSNVYNFGPASSRDNIVYTCQRPGGEITAGNKINAVECVDEWMRYMSSEKIKHVFILLSKEEMEDYSDPGLIAVYESYEIVPHHIPIANRGSYDAIMTELERLYDKGEKAVAHCTHGMGRSGRVAAGWLVYKYGISIEEATEEVLATARHCGVERMGAPSLLKKWVEG